MATLDYDKIINGIRKALYGYEVREYLAQSMEWTKAFVTQSVVQIKDYIRQAEAARDAAKASQDAAKVSETNAKASENAAKASQNAAASSASAAASSASAAKTSETNAKASENAAKTSAGNAKASETNAKASESAAKTSETNAKTSETNAKTSETKAAASATNAKTSETNAKASADSMGTSVATCTAKAKEAEASAGKAAASERNAKTSEGNAKASEDEARQLVEEAKKVVNTDKTLTIDGAPADAKTVGDKFKSIKTDWNSVTDKPETFPPSAHTHSYAGSASAGGDATRALGVKDYAGSQTIEIGYATAGLTTSNLTHIAGYTENGTKIKDVSKDVLKSWLGVSNPYPVGSIYISTRSTSPASLFGGTWESIASERVLMGVSSSHGAGSTVSAGLPNIVGEIERDPGCGLVRYTAAHSGALGFGTQKSYIADAVNDSGYNLKFNAGWSNSIYGNSSTVQPAAYYVYMWRRTA